VRIGPWSPSTFTRRDRGPKYGAVDEQVIRSAKLGHRAADSPFGRRYVVAYGPRDPLELEVFQDHEPALAIGREESHTIAAGLEDPGLFD
jgi:hypothetical protein